MRGSRKVRDSRRQTRVRRAEAGNNQGTTAVGAAGETKEAGIEVNNWQTRGIIEMVARQKANIVKRELSEIQAKLEFQALILSSSCSGGFSMC
jgi:hypothetical protein